MLRKIVRKLKQICTRILIRNKQYKPKGSYLTIADYTHAVAEAECREIYPAGISRLTVTEDFKNNFVSYVETTTVADIPAARVVVVPGGRVHTDNNESVAIISHDNKLIGELSFNLGEDDPLKNRIFHQNYFQPPVKYNGVVFNMLIGEGGIINYSHWLVDSLPRIELLKKSGWFDKVDWFLVPSYKYDYQRESLEMLGIEADKVIAGEFEHHIQTDKLIATTYVRYHEHNPVWSVNFLRESFLKPAITDASQRKYPLIYISRNDSAKRRVLNEPELMAMLAQYGFKLFVLSKLSFKEKISLFYHADVIVATIGAGQSNMVFCQTGANVIELMPKDFAQPFFSDLAFKAGVNYDYLVCKSDGRADTFKQGEKINLIVDVKAVEEKLKLILKKKVKATA